MAMNVPEGRDTERAALNTPSDLSPEATATVAARINSLVADAYVLYLKTKNFHWHVSGPNFRDFHEMLDDQSAQILEFDRSARGKGAKARSADPALSGTNSRTDVPFGK